MVEAVDADASPRSLLERADEAATLHAVLEAGRQGRGSTVVIAGPAGIGKTTLLDVLAAEAARAGFHVARGHGRRLEREYAFGVALQLFEGLAGREELFTGSAALARPLLDPGTADQLPPGDSFSVIHGLYWLTAGLADEAPVLLVVDDVQWADDPSLRFLAYLAERLDGLPVVVALGERSEVGEAASRALDELVRHRAPKLVAPQPLSPAAVAELAGELLATAPEQLAVECHRLTAGNPLLVVETLREIASGGAPITGGSAGSPIEALLPGVRRRLERLGDAARSLAAAAAVVGDAPLPVLAEVAALTPRTAATALHELRAAALFEPDDPVRPIHGLVGDAIELDLDPGTRTTLHRQAFVALDRHGAPMEVLAAHARAVPPWGAPRVVEVLRRAARSAIVQSQPQQAVIDLRRALEEPLEPQDRPELLAELARAEALAGDRGWEPHIREATRLASHDPQAARLRLRVGDALFGTGALRDAAGQYERGLDAVDDPSSEIGLRLLAGLSQATLVDVTNDRSVLPRVEAALGPDPRGDTRAQRDLLRHLAYARSLRDGTRKEVLDLAHRAMRADGAIDTSREATFAVGVLAMTFADDEDVLPQLLDQSLERARADGQLALVAGLSLYRGTRRLWCGRIDDAIADLSLARDGLANAWAGILPTACAHLALAYIERDDLAAADAALPIPGGAEAFAATATLNAWLRGSGELRAAHGDLTGGLDDLLECGRRERKMRSLNPATIPWEFLAGELLARLGRHADAAALVDDALSYARRFGAPRTLAHGLRSAATLATGDERLRLLDEGLDTVRGTPWRLEHARIACALGHELVSAGRRHDGEAYLREALDVAHGTGAVRLAAAAATGLRATGARPRRPRITGPQSLTPGERVIADLAAAGHSNREIAELRFVTVKAVEFHLGNAYRKLAIRSRAELAGALADPR